MIFFAFPFFCYSQKSEGFHFDFHTNDHSKNPSFAEFYADLKNEISRYPSTEHFLTDLMITRIRKLYYNSPSFDRYLIKGLDSVVVTNTINEEKIRNGSERTLDTSTGFSIKIDDSITSPKDSSGKIVKLRTNLESSQEVSIDSCTVVDIGHVFCGLDAARHRSSVHFPFPFRFIRINNNHDAITWVGDLGSIVSEVYYKEKAIKRKLTNSELQNLINEYASPADNQGNIDSYVLDYRRKACKSNTEVSQFLFDYYQGNDSQCSKLKKDKYLIFSKSLGLDWDGKDFTNIKCKTSFYSNQVNAAASMYLAVAARRRSVWNLLLAMPTVLRLLRHPLSTTLVETFFTDLSAQIIQNQNEVYRCN
ncbi:MAG: hypothetical protein ACOYOA_01955 [Saprospiraceae bacterium]